MKIVELEVQPSVELAWLLANYEASLANHDCIRPAHVLLGVLKILDDNYHRIAGALKYSADALQQITDAAASCRPLLHLSDNELSAARRGLHKAIHRHDSGEIPSRVLMLQWSGDSFYLYQKSAARSINSGVQTITLSHLLEELLANLPLEAAPFFKNHPTAHLSTNSSEVTDPPVKYDSLLWNASAKPDWDL